MALHGTRCSSTGTGSRNGMRPSGNYLDPGTGEVLPTLGRSPRLPSARTMSRGMWRGSGRNVRRPGRARRVEGLRAVHQVPDEIPDQAHLRLPPSRQPRPGPTTPDQLMERCGTSPAHLPARTGSLRNPAQRRPRGPPALVRARARPTAASTSATRAAASWSPANGPAKPSPTTAPTGKPGS